MFLYVVKWFFKKTYHSTVLRKLYWAKRFYTSRGREALVHFPACKRLHFQITL